MINFIRPLLTPDEVHALRSGLETATWVDGTTTAGGVARSLKNNQQVDYNHAGYARMADIVRTAFWRNSDLRAAVLPAFVTQAMFNRYGPGMQYGPHVDMPLMGHPGDMLRTDVAITVFLSNPDSYSGGELTVVNADGTTFKFKEAAGAAVAYPANSLHHVTPVTQGARCAAILWVQSMVRDPARRELLWDLEQARQDIRASEGNSATFEAVNRSHMNLLRMWADV
ncbi:MAG TPA: Fe2+-dependent dioxygenase [Rhodanobacteraceae bacterium]